MLDIIFMVGDQNHAKYYGFLVNINLRLEMQVQVTRRSPAIAIEVVEE
ncbi:hypothetical protein ACP70R_045548 [Stipagrostis hirtigluma subsp. patula]